MWCGIEKNKRPMGPAIAKGSFCNKVAMMVDVEKKSWHSLDDNT